LAPCDGLKPQKEEDSGQLQFQTADDDDYCPYRQKVYYGPAYGAPKAS
jgi:hypothetical protein